MKKFTEFLETKQWLPRPQEGHENKKCPDCGQENPMEANFCYVCGANPKAEGSGSAVPTTSTTTAIATAATADSRKPSEPN